jgi:hypothetical protein
MLRKSSTKPASRAAADPAAQPDSTADPFHGGGLHIPRSRGAVSGLLLVIAGLWGAAIPFVGPAFDFGLSPDSTWHWNTARFWLSVLPGAATIVGGLLLLVAADRVRTSMGAWFAIVGGAWFVVGSTLADELNIGSPGTATGGTGIRALKELTYFTGLGAAILFLAALALGRLSVRSVRDVRAAQRREVELEAERRRQEAYAARQRAELQARQDAEAAAAARRDDARSAATSSDQGRAEPTGAEYSQAEYSKHAANPSRTRWSDSGAAQGGAATAGREPGQPGYGADSEPSAPDTAPSAPSNYAPSDAERPQKHGLFHLHRR